jgi:hypothetical protein
MTAKLMPLRSNELLDFVHRGLSAFPDLSMLILSSTVPTAAGRFNSANYQPSSLCKAQSIQHESAPKKNFASPDL